MLFFAVIPSHDQTTLHLHSLHDSVRRTIQGSYYGIMSILKHPPRPPRPIDTHTILVIVKDKKIAIINTTHTQYDTSIASL